MNSIVFCTNLDNDMVSMFTKPSVCMSCIGWHGMSVSIMAVIIIIIIYA